VTPWQHGFLSSVGQFDENRIKKMRLNNFRHSNADSFLTITIQYE
ncbi:gloverin, partial [Danaus plexippus plexippus]